MLGTSSPSPSIALPLGMLGSVCTGRAYQLLLLFINFIVVEMDDGAILPDLINEKICVAEWWSAKCPSMAGENKIRHVPLANIAVPSKVDGRAALCDTKILLVCGAHSRHVNALTARHGEVN